MFEPGDIVECVDAGPLRLAPPFRGRASGLAAGALYTVVRVYPKGSPHKRAGLRWRIDCCDVREAPHPAPDQAWDAARFRLLKRRDPGLMAGLAATPARLQETEG